MKRIKVVEHSFLCVQNLFAISIVFVFRYQWWRDSARVRTDRFMHTPVLWLFTQVQCHYEKASRGSDGMMRVVKTVSPNRHCICAMLRVTPARPR